MFHDNVECPMFHANTDSKKKYARCLPFLVGPYRKVFFLGLKNYKRAQLLNNLCFSSWKFRAKRGQKDYLTNTEYKMAVMSAFYFYEEFTRLLTCAHRIICIELSSVILFSLFWCFYYYYYYFFAIALNYSKILIYSEYLCVVVMAPLDG